MEGAYKKQWYKDKNDECKSKGYFYLLQPYILIINYGCSKDFLLIIKPNPSRCKTQFSQKIIIKSNQN